MEGATRVGRAQSYRAKLCLEGGQKFLRCPPSTEEPTATRAVFDYDLWFHFLKGLSGLVFELQVTRGEWFCIYGQVSAKPS
jgi:hypothetical protein